MRKIFLKFWAFITGQDKIVQAQREKNYLKNLEVSENEFQTCLIKLQQEALTPKEFVNLVNSQMREVYQFKDFRLKDVKTLDIFSSEHCEFLHTVYALVKPYGIFYVVVGAHEVFFKFTENIDWIARKAETFRIYEHSKNPAPTYYDIFYQCRLKKGIVKVYGVYKEWINSDGNFDTSIYDGIYLKFPT